MQHDENYRREAIANMAAAAKEVFGAKVPIEVTSTGICFPFGMGLGHEDHLRKRPFEAQLQEMLNDPKKGDAFLKKKGDDRTSRSLRCNLLRCRADALVKAKEHKKAVQLYLAGAEAQCGTTLPTRHARSPLYMNLDKVWEAEDVVACFTGAALALMKLGDYAQALFWLDENLCLFRNIRDDMNKDQPNFEWFDFNLGTSQYYLQKATCYNTLADAYLKLGNTGAGVYYRFQAQCTLVNMDKRFKTPELESLANSIRQGVRDISHYRHPEPSLVANLEVLDKKSHIHGSWKKIELKYPGGVTNRMGSAVFVHKGYLYTVGGQKFIEGPYYPELWRINLTKAERWEQLQTCHIEEPRLHQETVTGYKIAVGPDDKAYYFIGSPYVLYYDLKKAKWGAMMTRFQPDDVIKHWPFWPFCRLQDYTMTCVKNKLYVFGGHHEDAQLGCDLFLELNITTRTWRRLSGSLKPEVPSFLTPGPRINACSWVSKDQKRIYLMYGDASRLSAKLAKQEHGAYTSHGYDDIWSWDIEKEKWTREKFVGNKPSPRTEMAAVYNRVLDKVITFGGYSPNAPTAYLEQQTVFQYTYYADTFICDYRTPKPASQDPQASSAAAAASSSSEHTHKTTIDASPSFWRQVLTRGFPTYRAQPHLVVDDRTGKTYLFSGYINTEFVPSRVKNTSRSFCDLWELRIDLPGGGFEGVDLEEEARTAKAGPWQRCFSCGSAGPWKKCGGSCRGRVFFCSSQCLKDGWREHKETHKCRKVE